MKYSTILIIGVFLSVYVIASQFCEQLTFECELPNKTVDSINTTLTSLSISFLMGVFVFWITGPYNNLSQRRKRIWEIYDLFKELSLAIQCLEEELGVRHETIKDRNLDWFDDTCKKNLLSNLTTTLNKLFLYESMLTESEMEKIANIRRCLDVEVVGGSNDPILLEVNKEKLLTICESIKGLNNGIISEVNKRQSDCYNMIKNNNRKIKLKHGK